MENISMRCTVVSRKPFKHSQAQQFAKKTQISFLSLWLPVERVLWVFSKWNLLLAPLKLVTAFVQKLSPSVLSCALCSDTLLDPCVGAPANPVCVAGD